MLASRSFKGQHFGWPDTKGVDVQRKYADFNKCGVSMYSKFGFGEVIDIVLRRFANDPLTYQYLKSTQIDLRPERVKAIAS